jgi:hypothetical protein
MSSQFLPHLRENLILLVSQYAELYNTIESGTDIAKAYEECFALASVGHRQKRMLRKNRIKISNSLSRELNPMFLAPLFEDIADAYLILADCQSIEKALLPEVVEKIIQTDIVTTWLWQMRHLSPPKNKDTKL